MARLVECSVCTGTRIRLRRLDEKKDKHFSKRKEWPYVYTCDDCRAECGTCRGTTNAVGLMADARTRHARFMAHNAFDKLWKGRTTLTRFKAYEHLARHLNLPHEQAHIGHLSYDQCQKVIEYSETFIKRGKAK